MVTVLNAGARAGYSGVDHLIDDRELKDIIGRDFRSVGEALKAADKRCWIDAYGPSPRRRHPYTWVEVRTSDGSVRVHYS